jgi:hypothetical protein
MTHDDGTAETAEARPKESRVQGEPQVGDL